MNRQSRFLVGIDLGTTNCALAYVDMDAPEAERGARVFETPQLIAPGEVHALDLLPAFIYLPEPHELRPEMLALPWQTARVDYAVGAWARDMAARVPAKVVSSAKSWLCYEGLDRRQPMLPWDRQAVPRQISPVDASRFYLEHFRDAWNHRMAGGDPELRLERQEVILTVPASFDAVARELTVEAASLAGLEVRLLEEPQAAFYAWLHEHEDSWRERVSAGDLILVCDIGGGTTDFSLIAANDTAGHLELQRIAVGDHILLGGDNMDLTLAYRVAANLESERGIKIDAYQLAGLAHACRKAKEELRGGEDEATYSLTVLGRGSTVVGGTLSTDLTGKGVREYLVNGFFPDCEISEKPSERRRIGLRSFGLDYAADPAITRHLADFLNTQISKGGGEEKNLPATVLFNGGVCKSPVLRERIVNALSRWRAAEESTPAILSGTNPDLAVASGAAWYAHVERAGGVRIKSGSPRSYYMGIEAAMPAVPGMTPPLAALCVVNFGLEEGSSIEVPAEGIGLLVGELTEFKVFSSTTRQSDTIGDVLEPEISELEEMPPLVVQLAVDEHGMSPIGTLVPVRLESVLTEVGTLQLWCQDTRSERRWKLEFELRERENTN